VVVICTTIIVGTNGDLDNRRRGNYKHTCSVVPYLGVRSQMKLYQGSALKKSFQLVFFSLLPLFIYTAQHGSLRRQVIFP
jgi:hypothetical protein